MTQPPPQFQFSGATVERLRELTGGDGRGGLFTSDLSVKEFAVIKQAGFHPLGLVMGSCIYHVGYQFTGWNTSQEVQVLSQAMYAARELAMQRMEWEAGELGADGVVGVDIHIRRWPWAESMLEFIAVGTGVKSEDGKPWRNKHGRPFLSALSGADFATLLSTGYQPVGLVLGTCVWHVAHLTLRQEWKTIGQNVEMTNFTQALYDARETAMVRMQMEAKELGAEGVVGCAVHESNHLWESHVIEFQAIGTAVVRRGEPRATATPVIVLG